MTNDPNRPLLWGHSQAVPQGESAAARTAGAQVNIRKPQKLLVLRSLISLWVQTLQRLHMNRTDSVVLMSKIKSG